MYRLVNSNLTKNLRSNKLVNCLRLNSTETSKAPVQAENAQAPTNPKQDINQTPQLSMHIIR